MPVTPGQALTKFQKSGLNWIARLDGKRDVVFAIDLTESVGINAQGKIHLRQLVNDSLKEGDIVHVFPFATEVYQPSSPVRFRKDQDVDEILEIIPNEANLSLRNTDIQCAELNIYRYVAQLNQNRLLQNKPIHKQSIIWITDAPLNTNAGEVWIEAPDSICGSANTPEGNERVEWLNSLPLHYRDIQPGRFKFAVVDIEPVVQEVCTPIPGGKDTCYVNPYIMRQLWLPSLIGLLLLGISSALLAWLISRAWSARKTWQLSVDIGYGEENETLYYYLPNKRQIAIGDFDLTCVDTIDCPGTEVRAYFERKGNQLYLVPTGNAPIYIDDTEVTQKMPLPENQIILNCPDYNSNEFTLLISVKK